jgi:hypothetical protein
LHIPTCDTAVLPTVPVADVLALPREWVGVSRDVLLGERVPADEVPGL